MEKNSDLVLQNDMRYCITQYSFNISNRFLRPIFPIVIVLVMYKKHVIIISSSKFYH